MKTNLRKWSRFLFVVLTVLSLAALVFPAMVQADPQECPTCTDTGCELLVNIVTPEDGAEIDKGDYFWVNATVALPANFIRADGVYATVCYDDCQVRLDYCCMETQGPVTLDECTPVADFWWKFKCIHSGDTTITVNASSADYMLEPGVPTPTCLIPTTPPDNGSSNGLAGSDCVRICQVLPECETGLDVEIMSCPVGPVMPGTTFDIMAYVSNITGEQIDDVNTWLELVDPKTGAPSTLAQIITPVAGPYIHLGFIRPGLHETVSWTVLCTGGGDVKAVVYAQRPNCPWTGECIVKDECTVVQVCEANLKVKLAPIPEKICTNCSNCFDVVATIENTCDLTGLSNVKATISFPETSEDLYDLLGPAEITIGDLGGGCETTVQWTVCCTGPGPVNIVVEATGWDTLFNGNRSDITDPKTVEQEDDLMVTILDPEDGNCPDNGFAVNTGETFDVTYRVQNCSGENTDTSIFAGVTLPGNGSIVLAPGAVPGVYKADVKQVILNSQGVEIETRQYTQTATLMSGSAWNIPLECLCGCCYADVTWHLKCVDSGSDGDCTIEPDEVLAFAGVDILTPRIGDTDSVRIYQMCEANLVGSLTAYEGLLSEDDLEGCQPIDLIAVGEDFTIVAAIANLGEAEAEDAVAKLKIVGPASTQQALVREIGDIDCHGSTKVIWEFHCEEEGPVTFLIEGIEWTDGNSGVAVCACDTNRGCPITVDQVPITVQIIDPLTSTNFIAYENFGISASITNHDSNRTLDCMYAELFWIGPHGPYTGMELIDCDDNPIYLGDGKLVHKSPQFPNGETATVNWEVRCTEPGDVTFWVVAYQDCSNNGTCDRTLDVCSEPETIHQWEDGNIKVEILSPKLNDFDVCDEDNHLPDALIATGEIFPVTVKIDNITLTPVTIADLSIEVEGYGPNSGAAVVVSGPTPNPIGTQLAARDKYSDDDQVIVSWTMRGTQDGPAWIKVEVEGEDPNCPLCELEDEDKAYVEMYEAAYLTVEVTEAPSSVPVGSDFIIKTKVKNIGQADASNVKLSLTVNPPGAASVTSGGYTQNVGSLYGHDNPVNCYEATWNLHCNAAGNTTFAVNASGVDEYGNQVKQICTSSIDWIEYLEAEIGDLLDIWWLPNDFDQITCCELVLHPAGLTAIQDGSGSGLPDAVIVKDFIEETSVTVVQGEGSGQTDPECDTVTINLEAGWNLISMPWYMKSDNRDPNVIFAGIMGDNPYDNNVNILYAYDACAVGNKWTIWSPDNPSNLIRDGKGYWLNLDSAATLIITGQINPDGPEGLPSYSVCSGWNLIGYKNGCNLMSIDEYLDGTSWVRAYTYDNGLWKQVSKNQNAQLQPGQGYWVAFTTSGTIYP